jgi:hypothetical protein
MEKKLRGLNPNNRHFAEESLTFGQKDCKKGSVKRDGISAHQRRTDIPSSFVYSMEWKAETMIYQKGKT